MIPVLRITTLRQTFSRRLLLLLTLFSLVSSLVIVLTFQYLTDQTNRIELNETFSHLQPRIGTLHRVWNQDADHMLDILEWSNILNLQEPARTEKLNAFFTAQADSMEFEGIVITDAKNDKLLFNFWTVFGNPDFVDFATANSTNKFYWYDAKHATLYNVIRKPARVKSQQINTYYFKAWDSAILRRIRFSGITLFISMGSKPLLSSAGNLEMEAAPPGTDPYTERVLNGIKYQEGTFALDELTAAGSTVPLILTVRAPLKNFLPIPLVLGATVGVTLLFGLMLFVVFGNWLRQLGLRLDGLATAALIFKNNPVNDITSESASLLKQADAGKDDQISALAHELTDLMESAVERDTEQRGYLQTLDLLQDAVIEFSPDGKLIRATDAWKSMTGIDDCVAHGIDSCVHQEDGSELLEQLSALTHNQKDQINLRFRMLRQHDASKIFWVEGRFAAVKHHDKVVRIRGVVRDITNTYLQERQINHMALHDALTDLPNRILLEDRLATSIARAARGAHRPACGTGVHRSRSFQTGER